MAFEEGVVARSIVMTTDYSAKQFMAIDLDTGGKGVAPAAGADAYGVVQNAPAAGQVATVAVRGITKMVAGAAVAANALVTVDTQGRAVTATTGNYVIGRARLAASGAGVVISVDLDNAGKV